MDQATWDHGAPTNGYNHSVQLDWTVPSHENSAAQPSYPYSPAPLPMLPARTPLSPSRATENSEDWLTPLDLLPVKRGPGRPRKNPDAPSKTPRGKAKQDTAKSTRQAPSEKPKRGKGSRSGTQNRKADVGESDEEIAKLSVEQMDDAELKVGEPEPEKDESSKRGLTEEDKLAAMSYITQTEVWKKFRLSKAGVFIKISQNICDGRVAAAQVENFWNNQVWDKYKACRSRESHTGGGDGDADRQIHESHSESDDEIEAVNGEKRKRKGPAAKAKFSDAVLDRFQHSKLYDLVDAVAHNDESVERHRDYNSSAPISDDEDPGHRSSASAKHVKREAKDESDAEISGLLGDALTAMKARQIAREKLEQDKIAIERAREERERRREDREHQEFLDRQEERKQKDAAIKFQRAMDLMNHPLQKMKDYGEKMMQDLVEQGLI